MQWIFNIDLISSCFVKFALLTAYFGRFFWISNMHIMSFANKENFASLFSIFISLIIFILPVHC